MAGASRSPFRAAGLGWLLLALAGCAKAEPVITIGFVGPLSGDQAPQGQGMLNGARLAMEHAALPGGAMDRDVRVELLALDDQHSPTQAVAAAKKLAANSSVLAVVGHLNSSCSMPASAVYHEARLLQITPVSSNPQISRQGFDTFHRTCATDDLQGPAASLFAVRELGATRIFILDDLTTYGRGLSNEFEQKARALGAEILGHEGIVQGDKDFTPLLTKIKSLQPDLTYFAGMFPEAALLLKQRHEVGLGGHFMASDGVFDAALLELAGPAAAEGLYLTTIGSDPHGIPTARAFVAAYEARYGPLSAYSTYAYEAARITLWAVQQAAERNPAMFSASAWAASSAVARRELVLAAMKTLKDYPGLFGAQNFDERGDSRIHDIGLFTVKDGRFSFLKTAMWDE